MMQTIRTKKQAIVGPLLSCPKRKCLEECPFRAARDWDVLERVMWLRNLCKEDVDRLYDGHVKCMAREDGES